MNDSWENCPECGCEEYEHGDELGEGYRVCKDCCQEWWTDIQYGGVSDLS